MFEMEKEIQECIEQMKEVQSFILDYVDQIDQQTPESIQEIDNFKFLNDPQKLKILLYIIAKISNNHRRSVDHFNMIERIIMHFKEQITDNFSNYTIFNIFKKNKRILLFLLTQKIINIDDSIKNFILESKKYYSSYYQYFLPEISLNEQKLDNDFVQNREKCENHSF